MHEHIKNTKRFNSPLFQNDVKTRFVVFIEQKYDVYIKHLRIHIGTILRPTSAWGIEVFVLWMH